MAIDVCSEISSLSISPRISFSHDLKETSTTASTDHRHRSDPTLLDSSSDFNFCIVNNLTLELSSAEELFSNGKILPIQIKNIMPSSSPKCSYHQPNEPHPATAPRRNSSTENTNTEKKRLKEFLATNFDTDEEENPPASKSFWQFRRSSSLNLDRFGANKSFIKSLQFLSRSNSTGSAPNQKQSSSVLRKENKKQNLQKQSSVGRSKYRRSTSCPNAAAFHANHTSVSSTQNKPCLRKSFGSHSNGVRVSPVLNLPHPYISKVTISFFGFGSLFCNGKVKKKKK
ncbi:membrane-associated kinase regulator [Parasponia andersonii]|uniref:Membrane-associated kinase regulator n=1 Tax=Parasponia andersonii TaxID=3476 RepID=A0A2P5BG07_PARAD|nr:membrane-associated kinase regulator [Parasponia andersonii]